MSGKRRVHSARGRPDLIVGRTPEEVFCAAKSGLSNRMRALRVTLPKFSFEAEQTNHMLDDEHIPHAKQGTKR